MVASRRIMTGTLLLVAASCAPFTAPGMAASNTPPTSDAARTPASDVTVLVAFPSSACTSTESAVFLDDEGRFVGSVAPGTAAALAVPTASRHLYVVGSLDVVASPGTWFVRHEVPRRSDQGVIVEVAQADDHNCEGKWSAPLSPRPRAVSFGAAVQATRGLTPLEVHAAEGRLWLDEHRERVDELVGRTPIEPLLQPIVTQVWPAR